MLQWGVFVLFAGCVFAMTLSVYLFFPETKVRGSHAFMPFFAICEVLQQYSHKIICSQGVPIEDCPFVFKKHWYWKRCAHS